MRRWTRHEQATWIWQGTTHVWRWESQAGFPIILRATFLEDRYGAGLHTIRARISFGLSPDALRFT
jgi:hypothetical protein